MSRLYVLLVLLHVLWDVPVPAHALTLQELDPEQEWWMRTLTIEGNAQLSTARLQQEMVTETRPWHTPWRALPRFDPVTFATDVERLQRLYLAQGYYQAKIGYDVEVNATTHEVIARITIMEGLPVYVTQLTLDGTDQPTLLSSLQALRPTLPLAEGMLFTEEHYLQTETKIREFFLAQGYGRVKVTRKAIVRIPDHAVHVSYTTETGPLTVFGETRIEGTVNVDPALVTRELPYVPGERFSARALAEAQHRLLKLDLFRTVRFLQEDHVPAPEIMPVRVQVEEKPFREWQLGGGYGSEDEFRGFVRWRHNNWLGGGRRLDVLVKASTLTRHLEVSFLQPHVYDRDNRLSVTFRPQQLDEPGYQLNASRWQARLEREFATTLSGFLAYRLEYDQLNNVSPATIRRLPGFARTGALSGLSLGVLWNTADDPLNSTTGNILSFSAEQAGDVLGGDFHFVKLQGEAKMYRQIAKQTVLATRLKLGFAAPMGGSADIPLFERFYAGGATSVRGYDRHRLGPLSTANDPVGGRSVLEGSVEIRRRLFEKVGGAVFLDFGQVSMETFDLPITRLKFVTGFGVDYVTPVGPLRLDLGFPFSPPRGDQRWQIHFSIGQFF